MLQHVSMRSSMIFFDNTSTVVFETASWKLLVQLVQDS